MNVVPKVMYEYGYISTQLQNSTSKNFAASDVKALTVAWLTILLKAVAH